MARAVLIAALLVPGAAQALSDFTDRPEIPEQMIGLQGRLGAGALAGEGAGDVDQPPLTHASISIHVRLLPDWYLELSSFGERTLNAEAPEGKTILGIEGTTGGIRWRPLLRSKESGNRLILGFGGGGGRIFVQGKGLPGGGESFGGGEAYVLAGFEKELYGDQYSAGYVGLEGVAQQYFVGEDSPFRGTGVTVRMTFSYYMGGSYCAECW